MLKQLVVASEYGEPSNYQSLICNNLMVTKGIRKTNICLLLITKNLPGCDHIIITADKLEISTQIHCTITGLGGTKLEPHIPTPNLMVKDSVEFIQKYKIDPKVITIRIDPIVPEFLDLQMAEASYTLEAFADIGVRGCRISIVDYYPHIRARFDKLGIEHPGRFQPLDSAKESIINQLFHLTCKFNMNLHLCAESIPKGLAGSKDIDTEGCASAASWERIGIDGLRSAARKQRRECTCDLEKRDLLVGLEKGCKPGCAYCYWKDKVGYNV